MLKPQTAHDCDWCRRCSGEWIEAACAAVDSDQWHLVMFAQRSRKIVLALYPL